MRPIFIIVLITTLVFSTSYLYQTQASICQVPFRYTIGEFDEGFPLTPEEAKATLEVAEATWERGMARELFVYDESADFRINFVFDERQAKTVAEASWREKLDTSEAISADIAEQYNLVLSEYEKLETAYRSRVDVYEETLESFNALVEMYNKDGGAPPAVFQDLQQQERDLSQTKDELQNDARKLESVVADLNVLGEKGNHLIEQYNEGVEKYNTTFGEVGEFTQGDYQGDYINIYTFQDKNELARVLVHEFGHALDIGHVEGSDSMMYYLMEDQPTVPILSEEDQAAFVAVCGTGKGIINTVRVLINKILSNL